MLSQISALLYVYYKDQSNEINQEKFTYYCLLIGFLNLLGFILNVFEQNSKTKDDSPKIIMELICSLLGLIFIITYFIIYFMEFSIASIQILIGLILIWLIECSFYYVLTSKGLQNILSLFVTTSILLINGEIVLKGNGQFRNLLDYSSINLIVLCAQFSWVGFSKVNNKSSLFYIISRQDCFRLMVYFLLFNLLNNVIKAIQEDIKVITPTLITIIPYILATNKFSQRNYKQSFGLFLLCFIVYFPIDLYVKQQQQIQQSNQLIEL